MVSANVVLIVLSLIIFVGFLARTLFELVKIPDVVGLLLLGIVLSQIGILGQDLLLPALPIISAIALIIILFEAGLNIELSALFQNAPRGGLIAALSMILSAAIVGAVAAPLLNISYLLGALLGAIIGGTSSPLVIGILDGVEADEGIKTTLRIESIVTDPLVIVVSIALMEAVAEPGALSVVVRNIFGSFALSIVVGFLTGLLWLFVLNRLKEERFIYVLTLGFLFVIYPVTEGLGGSGAVASFLFGITLANGERLSQLLNLQKLVFGIPEEAKHFNEELSFFIKTFFFVTLGAILTFSRPILFLYGAGFTLLVFIARIGAVELGMFGTRASRQQKHLMYFILPRGLAAAIVAFIPISMYRLDGVEAFAATGTFPEIVFSVIIGTILIASLGAYLSGRRGKDGEGEHVLTEEGVQEGEGGEVELKPVSESASGEEEVVISEAGDEEE